MKKESFDPSNAGLASLYQPRQGYSSACLKSPQTASVHYICAGESMGALPAASTQWALGWDCGRAVTSTVCAVQAQAPPGALLCWGLGLGVAQHPPHMGKSALDSWILQFDSLV